MVYFFHFSSLHPAPYIELNMCQPVQISYFSLKQFQHYPKPKQWFWSYQFGFLFFIPISVFSTKAAIIYSIGNRKSFPFHYNCSTTELLLGVTDQLYEVDCYPEYTTNQKFFAPKTQDEATIFCVTVTHHPGIIQFSGHEGF